MRSLATKRNRFFFFLSFEEADFLFPSPPSSSESDPLSESESLESSSSSSLHREVDGSKNSLRTSNRFESASESLPFPFFCFACASFSVSPSFSSDLSAAGTAVVRGRAVEGVREL